MRVSIIIIIPEFDHNCYHCSTPHFNCTARCHRYSTQLLHSEDLSTSCSNCYNTTTTMEFTKTQRGARSLLYSRYSYMMNRRGRDGSVYWRCTRSRNSHCTGTITTDIDDRLVFIKPPQDTHNHPRDNSAIVAKRLVNDLKSKTQDNIRPVPQLYLEEIQRVAALPNADEIPANLPTFSAVKSALYRQRRKLIPALPSTRAEVAFEGEWA